MFKVKLKKYKKMRETAIGLGMSLRSFAKVEVISLKDCFTSFAMTYYEI